MTSLGIDIGGSGVKGNLVDAATGETPVRSAFAYPLPASGSTEAVAEVVAEIAEHFRQESGHEALPVGCGFPGVIRSGVVSAATHLDKAWLGANVVAILSQAVGSPVTVLNDADAAGVAEITFGSAKDRSGTVLMITLGTGIGSGMFRDGRLVPNFELGMLELGGHHPIEDRVAYRVFKQGELSWKKWAKTVEPLPTACQRALRSGPDRSRGRRGEQVVPLRPPPGCAGGMWYPLNSGTMPASWAPPWRQLTRTY